MTKQILIIISMTLITACGPSAAEIANRERLKSDSIAKAIKEALIEEQDKAEEQGRLKQHLIELKAALAGEESKLQSIYEFKLMRSQDEKAQQVAHQTQIVEQLKAEILEVEKMVEE